MNLFKIIILACTLNLSSLFAQNICKGYFKKEHVTILNNFSKNPK